MNAFKIVVRIYGVAQAIVAVLFAIAGVMLVIIAAQEAWQAFITARNDSTAQTIIESIGLLAAAVVALQISQTIAEEEVIRGAHVSAPTRVRRFLSRFIVVVVVALAIEGLVATFKALHEDPKHLTDAASILVGVSLLLAGWGVFIWCNRSAEELEPEAMEEAKQEDQKLK